MIWQQTNQGRSAAIDRDRVPSGDAEGRRPVGGAGVDRPVGARAIEPDEAQAQAASVAGDLEPDLLSGGDGLAVEVIGSVPGLAVGDGVDMDKRDVGGVAQVQIGGAGGERGADYGEGEEKDMGHRGVLRVREVEGLLTVGRGAGRGKRVGSLRTSGRR